MPRKGLRQVRLLWAIMGVLGLVLQIISTEHISPGYFLHPSLVLNFFSFFTILTNLSVTIWFILAFRSMQQGQRSWWGDDPRIKGALIVAGTLTIIVYWTLLSEMPLHNAIGEVANLFLHLLTPAGMLVDWVLAKEKLERTYAEMISAWLLFPLVFVIYSEIRGPFAKWYPYFFLDPRQVGGFGPLLGYIVGIFILFAAVGSVLYWLYNKWGDYSFQ